VVADEQVGVILLAVELAVVRAYLRIQLSHHPLSRGEGLPVRDVPPVLCDVDKIHVEIVNNTPASADIGAWFLACRHILDAIFD
jgi:hypothetical protein